MRIIVRFAAGDLADDLMDDAPEPSSVQVYKYGPLVWALGLLGGF